MELKKAEYLLVIYRHQNLTSAAEELFLSPQALSKTVKSLEEEFGETILERNGNRFLFTAFGETLVKECTVLLAQYHTFMQNMDSFKKMKKKHIRIDAANNVSLMLGNTFFTLPIFHNPDYEISFNEYTDYEVDRRLYENLCDIALCVNLPDHVQEYMLVPLLEYTVGVFLSRKHPLAQRESVSLKDIQEYPILSRNENFKPFNDVEKKAQEEHCVLKYRLKSPGDAIWQTMIQDHTTAAIALSCIVHGEESVFIPLKEEIRWTLHLAIRKNMQKSPQIKEVMDAITEYICTFIA